MRNKSQKDVFIFLLLRGCWWSLASYVRPDSVYLQGSNLQLRWYMHIHTGFQLLVLSMVIYSLYIERKIKHIKT